MALPLASIRANTFGGNRPCLCILHCWASCMTGFRSAISWAGSSSKSKSSSNSCNAGASTNVEVIAPFGGAEEMVKDLKEKVFPSRPVSSVKVQFAF